ncbi:hypothetical protein CALCODRAFT_296587 [Calocera cornea HHB12733]|uniref:HTH APSES-type domain-containing protein n=1 Tax=Calocera cornea HHB12733 TaxID=1353952 RepID=A0A165FLA6_9BASI|nr:hypothetical protein CALCODRAFT_296587 [Calocera cornea HHB12733]
MSTASVAVPAPTTNDPKPEIPSDLLNPKLTELVGEHIPQVKFQVITREGQEIVVGRVKIPHPNGHAFILRRFDTGAVSLTTMIRAAFPAATDDMEKSVTNWVRANYPIQGANGPTAAGTKNLRLAGTWIPSNLAMHLASDYGLADIISPLVVAEPDPAVSYRKSARSAAASPVAGVPTPAPVIPVSPAPAGGPATRASTRQSSAPQATPTHPNKRQRTAGPSPLATTNGLTPASAHQRTSRTIPISPLASNSITVEDEAHADEPSSGTLFPTPEEDRAETQNLISQLSKQAPNYAPAPLKESTGRKRALSQVDPEMPTGLNPVDHPWETGTEVARVIAGNRRAEIANARGLGKIAAAIPRPATETGRRIMWGSLMFTFGVAATAFSAGIPQLFF